MTTDTAVRVTRLIVQERSKEMHNMARVLTNIIYHIVPLDKIPYVDYPELRINKNESTEMPFRYVKGEDGECIMPEVRMFCRL